MKARLWMPLLAVGLLALVIAAIARPFAGRLGESPQPGPTRALALKAHPMRPLALAPPHHLGSEVAIIIDDCGQAIGVERAMLALPIPMTFSILPRVAYTQTIEREAMAMHKDVMLHLPMESLAHLDPGLGAITTAMADAAIVTEVRDDLRDVALARGFNNHEGSMATADSRVMRDVMSVAAAEHRFFIDSRTTPYTVAIAAAHHAGVPNASRSVFLDNEADPAYIEGMLRRAARIGKRTGTAIAIGHPRPATLLALREMIPPLEASGIHFTFVSTMLHP